MTFILGPEQNCFGPLVSITKSLTKICLCDRSSLVEDLISDHVLKFWVAYFPDKLDPLSKDERAQRFLLTLIQSFKKCPHQNQARRVL